MATTSNHPELLAVYGTLRRRSVFRSMPGVVPRLRFFGYGLIRGRIFWQGRFPALVDECGLTKVEVFRVVQQTVWHDLDRYEGYDPMNPLGSLFTRRQVILVNARHSAWAYFLNRNIPLGSPVEGSLSGS
jgi:gamma-glutamylcyclotransferase (GGCT)/AIG2-like uncharacterized protein YtfP